MFFLLLAMISSMLVSVVMRLSEGRSRNRITMLAVNYIACTTLSALFAGTVEFFPAAEGLPTTLLLGGVSGVMYLAGFLLLQWNISKNGVVLPATFMKLGVVVPTLLAITVFGESPRWTQLAGFALAVAAIVMIQGRGGQEARSAFGLIALLLVGGLTDSLSKVYEQYGSPVLEDHYLLYTFGMAMLLCIGLCVYKKQGVKWLDVFFGVAIAVPNYFSARFLLLSLSDVPAVVAYPSYSVGTIVLAAVAGAVLFKEKLSRRKLCALGVILLALVLLNV